MMKNKVAFIDLGIVDYHIAWQKQEKLFNKIIEAKKSGNTFRNYLIFCQHPHVYTLGKSGSENNLLINAIQLQARDAVFVKTNRGGDITYHGPGQLVGYPIFDLESFNIGLKKYIYLMEEAIIQTLQEYNISSDRLKNATGVWIDTQSANPRKICSIGVKSSRYVTMHGFALNINTDLNYFDYINPCGFTDKKMTSLQKELSIPQADFNETNEWVKKKFIELFNISLLDQKSEMIHE